ncbi:MAG: Queuine/archaeosine tRNA-ribosyltransferase [Haloquadratum walsbyi J07HQW1]|jgi:7-cyano-7-deazaguanine tRNA-ribosyltransferase|uniref:tRNA-guanine(15) transglycosylase n=1 Tax=Haloquadratum walsbyi J07HQW1 TaxID=1238424 RepID=U1PIA8_9EURY|nr:MAG: Queuine/archaeosine tRNA-ribosyltransferase [Haloquadratum walsbyi J07HQW1]
MSNYFERLAGDAAGRIGEITIPRANMTIETPALLPVINPNIETVSPADLQANFGVDILITNAYIIYTNDDLRAEAKDQGVHELLDFEGAIVTDSGSFQLAEYGDIDVTTRDILSFQQTIGADIATPVDIPTPPDVTRGQAEQELALTKKALADAETTDTGSMLVNAPIQGSTFVDLRETAGKHAVTTDLDVFPIGGVVPLLNNYQFATMIDVVIAAKRGLGPAAPVHLFGAGHPMMFALAVAAGCDMFDSAAYAIYARDDRYLTVRGTKHLDELEHLPCSCAVCAGHTPAEFQSLRTSTREQRLAEHNLAVSYAELRRIKQAIRRGSLLELVEIRARSHPAVYDGYRALLDHTAELEARDPVRKASPFIVSAASAERPEVYRHHERLSRLRVPDSVLLTEGGVPTEHEYDAVWRVVPPFGPFPRALSETYPLTAEIPEHSSIAAQQTAAAAVCRLVEANPDTEFSLAHNKWAMSAVDALPERVTVESLGEISNSNDSK